MPLIRYFLCVGGALVALLFLADATLPKSSVEPAVAEADIPSPIVRIHSDRKWPERIVFDTSGQAMFSAMAANNAPVETQQSDAGVNMPSTTSEARIGQAFAELQPSDIVKTASKPKAMRKLASAVAKKRTAPPIMLAAQRQQFGFISNSTW